MMDFILPHAILVTKPNFTEILRTVPISYDALLDICHDSITEHTRYYIVGERHAKTGVPIWTSFAEVELAIEYRLKSTKKFENSFRKIIPYE